MGFACGCDEPADVFNTTIQKARKPHKCLECGHTITPGQEYKRIKMLFDGFWSDDRICERCDDLQAAFADLGYCYSVGEFFESYGDWLEEQRPCPEDEEDPPTGHEMATNIQLKHRNWLPPSSVQSPKGESE